MSKFFVQGNVSDSSDSDNQSNNAKQKTKKLNYEYEDDDYHGHQQKRKILTEKQKKKALFKKLGGTVTNALNNKDWDKVWDNLQEMLKQIEKSSKFIEKQGTPVTFLKTLKVVNDQVAAISPEEKKKMKNPKNFNILKQKLKNKIIPEYENKLKEIENLPNEESSSSQESVASKASSEQSESEVYRQFLNSDDPMVRRKYWLKRELKKKEQKQSSSDEQKINKNQSKKPKFKLAEVKAKEQLIIADSKEAQNKIKKISADFVKITNQEKREEYLSALDVIVKESIKYKDSERLSILLADIPIRIQVTRQMKLGNFLHFPRESWLKQFHHLTLVFQILRQSEDEDLIQKIVHFEENSDSNVIRATEKSIYELIRSFIMNLVRQLNKSFSYLDNSELEYSERLQDLIKFTDFIYKVSKDLSFKEELEQSGAQIAFKVLENCYFMNADFMMKIQQSSKDVTFTQLADEETLQSFVKPILALRNQQFTNKAILYLVYNHALNRRQRARDLFTVSNIHEIIQSCDYYTQAIYNRAVVQLGISAFCRGCLDQARQILDGVCGLGKNREQNKQYIRTFLAQNQKAQGEALRSKILPYYLHFSIQLIEAVQLMSSMILEVPYTLSEGGRITSKTFKRVFYQYQRSHFIAEPLNFRDLVYAASNSLKLGNWKDCFEKLTQINIWNEIGNQKQVKQNLLLCVKESALRCYLLANKKCLKCVALSRLADKFQLDVKVVRRFLCRWINQKERELTVTITDDDYLNILEKRKDTESDLQRISEKLFSKLEDLNVVSDQSSKQKQPKLDEDDEQNAQGQNKFIRKINVAITQKLKTILNRRAGLSSAV